MRRLLHRAPFAVPVAVGLALACFPTEPCACTPPLTAFLAYGRVVQSDGRPQAGAHLRFDAPNWRQGAECVFDALTETLSSSSQLVTDDGGSFRVRLLSPGTRGSRCMRVTAFRGLPGSSDSVQVSGIIVQFRSESQRPDSLGIQLTLP